MIMQLGANGGVGVGLLSWKDMLVGQTWYVTMIYTCCTVYNKTIIFSVESSLEVKLQHPAK